MSFKTTRNKIKINILSLIIYLVFPIILLFCLFLSDKFKLNFSITGFHWWQLFTCSFVHNNPSHYINNLIIYLIFGFIILMISYRWKFKEIKLFLITFLILPIVNSIIHFILIYPNDKISPFCGSSVLIVYLIYFVISYYLISLWKYNKIGCVLFLFIFIGVFFIFYGGYLVYFAEYRLNLGHLIGILGGILIGIIYSSKYKIKGMTAYG
jgi:membrane associated rhomboid family serine protease